MSRKADSIHDQEEKLQEEILQDAQRKADRTMQRAKRDAEKKITAVKERFEKLREIRLEEARLQAENEYRAITAGTQHEVRSDWLRRREQVLDDLLQQLLTEVEQGQAIDKQQSLQQLLQEALQALGAVPVVIRMNPNVRAHLPDTLLRQTIRELYPQVEVEWQVECGDDIPAGLIVSSADGRRSFDNTYRTRLLRLKNRFRCLLCQNIDSARDRVDNN